MTWEKLFEMLKNSGYEPTFIARAIARGIKDIEYRDARAQDPKVKEQQRVYHAKQYADMKAARNTINQLKALGVNPFDLIKK